MKARLSCKSVLPKQKLFSSDVTKCEQRSVKIKQTTKYIVLSKAYSPYGQDIYGQDIYDQDTWHRQYGDVWFRKRHNWCLLTRFDMYYSQKWRLTYDDGKPIQEPRRGLMQFGLVLINSFRLHCNEHEGLMYDGL